MNHQNSEVAREQQTRVVRQTKPDPTPPPDHEDWVRSQDLSFDVTRKVIEKRRKKAR